MEVLQILAMSKDEAVVMTADYRIVVVDRHTGEPVDELELVKPHEFTMSFLY